MQNAETILSLLLSGLVDGLCPVYCQKTFCCTTNNIFCPNFFTFVIRVKNFFSADLVKHLSDIPSERKEMWTFWATDQITSNQTPWYHERVRHSLDVWPSYWMLNFRDTLIIEYTISEIHSSSKPTAILKTIYPEQLFCNGGLQKKIKALLRRPSLLLIKLFVASLSCVSYYVPYIVGH